MRSSFLHFALPDFGEAEQQSVRDVLASGWITTGPKTRELETAFARAVGAKHAVAVNSCTAALHLALEAAGIAAGDEVITTPYTFAASAEVIRYFGATPVFADIDRRTFNLDPANVAAAITPRTKAVIPVHIAGLSCDLDPLLEICRPRGIVVIEDAAHAFPATYRRRTIGAISDFTCFSFYATKTIATGEGGMLCTDDEARAERCRMMSLHGISRDAWNRYGANGSWAYEVVAPGYKYNLTDIAAALGLVQLERSEEMTRRREEIAFRYDEALGGDGLFELPALGGGGTRHAWHLYMLRLHLDRWKIDRRAFIEELKKRNIGASVHFIPLHMQPYYRDLYRFAPDAFPIARAEFLREVSLPIYSKMTDDDVDSVIDAIRDVAREHGRR
ncbi:MAG TPA: DegT/DnrJ/EryC1/StrS aminotransferase family protein [Thermoanaerobaculia bacterium]|nr:DegT/DnrJ/EryC1/StrS aminotransferase family protein [Thermoanaerobaculia bacterium]